MYIAPYKNARNEKFDTRRPRKLLLRAREIKRLLGHQRNPGMTLVPLEVYLSRRNFIKLTLAVVKGKNKIDKREDIKARDWKREQSRILKGDKGE